MAANGKRLSLLIATIAIVAMAISAHPPALCAEGEPAAGAGEPAYIWTIEKVADQSEVTLSRGQQLEVDYTVTVMATPSGMADPNDPNVDSQVNVYDDNKQPRFLGTVCVDETPKTFNYRMIIGPYCKCGDYEVCNTALFVTRDTRTTGSSSWIVTVNVPCEDTCTLTHGYWKTHSNYGPAPYDDTWALLDPNGEDSAFFDTGMSWYNVLWTQGKDTGNVYYVLAHDYIAAVLNELNGASVPADIMDAIAHAEELLDGYDGDPNSMEVIKQRDAKEIRRDFIKTAIVLNRYNNGGKGPGKCSE
jgi:hypothetical protein